MEKSYLFENNNDQRKNFYDIWTKKEAYIKYRSEGIFSIVKGFDVFSPHIAELLYTFSFLDYTVSVCGKQVNQL